MRIALITGTEPPTEHPEAVRALIDFYRAFNHRDFAAMERNWWNSDEAILCNPLGGFKRGWNEIRTIYERLFNGPATVYVEYYDITLTESGELFFAAGRERGTFQIGDTEITLAIRTTRVYRRVNGAWRQAHHHGSIDDAQLLARYQAAVLGK
jgi:ketosteroid isomerase-like protein